ncbi:MAG: T9SS type A sorting domain-containing protein [Bacteroidia bacterium]
MFNKLFTLLLTLATFSFVSAQEVALSYEVLPSDEEGFTLNVYAQSYTESSFDLGAINLSAALPEGCVAVEKGFNMMSETWTDYLERGQEVADLELNYESLTFQNRYQYGNANPGLPATSEIILPPSTHDAMLIMSRTFKGSCEDLYMEHQSENRLNQLTGSDMVPVEYVIRHPQRTTTPEETLEVMVVDVAPNPTTDWVTISLVDAKDSYYGISVYDVNGRLIYTEEKEMGPSTVSKTPIDLRKEAAGMYIIEVVDKVRGQSHALRVLKN